MFKAAKLALALLVSLLTATQSLAQDVAAPLDLSTGRPILTLTIADGATVKAMLDTGGQGAVITQSLVDELKLEVIGEAFIGSPYGGPPKTAKIVALPSLSLGGLTLSRPEAVVLPDGQIPKDSPRLTISSVQFGARPYILDFAAYQLVVPAKVRATKIGWHKIDERNMPVAEIVIGKDRTKLVLDSGNPGSFVLPRTFALATGAKLSDKPVGKIRTIDASFDRYTGIFNRDAVVAGQRVRLGTVSVVDGMGANMGSKALAGFQLTIDMPNRRWRLDRADGRKPVIDIKP